MQKPISRNKKYTKSQQKYVDETVKFLGEIGINITSENHGMTGDAENSPRFAWSFGNDPKKDFTIAAVVPKNIGKAQNYLDKVRDYEETNQDRSTQIKNSRKLCKFEGVVATAVEALTELAVLQGGYISNVKKPDLKKLCNVWLKRVNAFNSSKVGKKDAGNVVSSVGGAEEIFEQIMIVVLRDGDWVATNKWEKVEVEELNKKFSLPTKFTTHDILSLEIDEELYKLGIEVIKIELSNTIVDAVKNPDDSNAQNKAINEGLSEEMKKQIRESSDNKIALSSDFTFHIKRSDDGISPWSYPYTIKAFKAVAQKLRLLALDESTIAGLIQRITLIKLGIADPKSPLHYPKKGADSRMTLANTVLSGLKTNNLIVWPGPDISVEDFGPEGKILEIDNRYKQADDDILKALGVSRLLIDGNGAGSDSRDWAAFLKTISQLEGFRLKIKKVIDRILRQIAVQNGFKDEFPRFNFRKVNLKDERSLTEGVIKVWRNGLMGRRVALYELGYDAEEVIEDQKKEKAEKLSDQLELPVLPDKGGFEGRPQGIKDGEGDSPSTKINDDTTEDTKNMARN